jgi:hypothetical protein
VALSAVVAPVSSDSSPLSVLTAGSVVADSGALSSAGARQAGGGGGAFGTGSPDDDQYFDSPSDKRLKATPQDVQNWLVKIKQFADCYGAAGASLLSKVERSCQDASLENEDVSRHLMNIVLNACETHMETDADNVLGFGRVGGADAVDMNG